MATRRQSPSMQRMQAFKDTVDYGSPNRSGLKQSSRTDLGVLDDGSTRYYHGKGYGTISESGKLLTTDNDGHITHTQDAKEIARYKKLREAEALKKEQQNFAREVNEANPTEVATPSNPWSPSQPSDYDKKTD